MSDTQTIKDRLDIVDFIGEYVQLKPAGINHKGLCPFHHEKSPSFMVNRDRQFWHCFGCQKGGDIFSFIQEMEGLDFPEALRLLAEKAGVPLENLKHETGGSPKNRLKDILAEAVRFYHKFLLQMPVAEPARAYLHTRGLSADTIELWQIGYSADQWDLVTQYLLKKGHSIDDLVASGLTIAREGANRQSGRGFYDRFRGRIMFPILDVLGAVVGFTARILVETENSGGKYINTPQTLLYDKSRVVFGLNKAKQEIKSKDLAVMVEGQMDVIACHQYGMKNVVATSGTAMTEEQVKLLKRYSTNLSIAFDADVAGQNAAKRGIEVALGAGMNIKVIRIPEGAGKDPDECIKKNASVWLESVDSALPIMSWYIDKALKGRNLSDPRAKQQATDQVLPDIVRIPYAVERDHWLRLLAARLGVEVSVLIEDMKRWKRSEKIELPATAQNAKEEAPLHGRLERLLSLLLKFSNFTPEFAAKMPKSILSTSIYSPLYEAMKNRYTNSHAVQEANFRETLDSASQLLVDILSLAAEKDFSNFTEKEARQEFDTLIRLIRAEWMKTRRTELQKEIAEAEREKDAEKLELLIKEFQELSAS